MPEGFSVDKISHQIAYSCPQTILDEARFSFIRRNVLERHLSDGLDNIGSIKLSLALCVLSVFLLVYFSLWKGVRSTGKVMFQATSNCN